MKNLSKSIFTLCLAATVAFTSCKKVAIQKNDERGTTANAKYTDQEIGKKLALNLYEMLKKQVGDGSSVKPGNVAGAKAVNSTTPSKYWCGQTFSSGDTVTSTLGDTTYTSKFKNSISYLCTSGDLNKWYEDGYNSSFSVQMTSASNSATNSYTDTQNYEVRGIDIDAFKIAKGIVQVSVHNAKTNGAVTTAFETLSTVYQMTDIIINRSNNLPRYRSGRTTFNSQLVTLSPAGPVGGTFDSWSGFFDFLSNDTIDAYIKMKNAADNAYMKFNIDLKTGVVTTGVKVNL